MEHGAVKRLGIYAGPDLRTCRNLSVIVTVIAVRMVQVTIDKIIHMVPMRYCFVPAIGAMHMPGFVTAAFMVRGAGVGVRSRHPDGMLVVMALVRVVHMAIVQVIYVSIVFDGGVTASGAMFVVVVIMRMMMFGHAFSLSLWLERFAARCGPKKLSSFFGPHLTSAIALDFNVNGNEKYNFEIFLIVMPNDKGYA